MSFDSPNVAAAYETDRSKIVLKDISSPSMIKTIHKKFTTPTSKTSLSHLNSSPVSKYPKFKKSPLRELRNEY